MGDGLMAHDFAPRKAHSPHGVAVGPAQVTAAADGDFTAAAADVDDGCRHIGAERGRSSSEAERRFFQARNGPAVPAETGPHFCQEGLAVDSFADGTGGDGTDRYACQLFLPAFHGRKGRFHPCR